ncbi:hypothetical protein BH11PLA2_BH11PLA2_00950 [soil metagenome]
MRLLDQQLLRLFEPALRGYLLAAMASLLVIFAVKFEDGALAAAGVPVLCGIAGLLLRWTAMPVIFTITLCYFILFPVGIPTAGFSRLILRDTHFRPEDMLLAAAVLVYLFTQFRIFSLNQQAIPKLIHSDAVPRRETATIQTGELPRMLITAAVAVIIGQVLWLLLTNLEYHFGDGPLLRFKPSAGDLLRRLVPPSTQSSEMNRGLLLASGGMFFAVVISFVYWYWRIATLNANEARLILLDQAWREDRREYARLETWRAAKLGHLAKPPSISNRVFRWVVRAIVLAIFLGFLTWISYVNYNNP